MTQHASNPARTQPGLFDRPDPSVMDAMFDADQPGVYALYAELAEKVRAAGFTRYSSDALLHRIRWHHQVERGDRDFKCNDHWTAYLARRLMREHPDFAGFFELRRLTSGGAA